MIAIRALAFLLGAAGLAASARADVVPVTLLHTNDLHSHFRPEPTPLALGGIARIKTAINLARKATPSALLVDGGDWSEGNIYYLPGAGAEVLRMMDAMGYDVAVVGNHDWLNGPDVLLNAIEQSESTPGPHVALVGANVDATQYARGQEFRDHVAPYVIREVKSPTGGAPVRIAFIGLVTYEFIYDGFFKPIGIVEPYLSTERLAADLKRQNAADAVVVISHNTIGANQEILKAAPDVDLIIGAHDHTKLTKPVVVERPGHAPAWIVETGCWGHYLGRVDFNVNRDATGKASVELLKYGLQQMDATVPEDPAIVKRIDALDAKIQADYGRDWNRGAASVFHDHVADAQVDLGRGGQENRMGNFTADAYRKAIGADLGLDVLNFIYGELHRGPLNTADFFNSNPGVFDPATRKAWTLHKLPIQGATLEWVLNVLLAPRSLAQWGLLATSGLQVTYDPLVKRSVLSLDRRLLSLGGERASLDAFTIDSPVLKSVVVNGSPLDPNATYQAAVSGACVQALEIGNSILPVDSPLVPLDGLVDTGLEDWRVMTDYGHAISPLTARNVPVGGRIVTLQPDLGLDPALVTWRPRSATKDGHVTGDLSVTVRNYGATASPEARAQISLLANRRGADESDDPDYMPLGDARPIDALAPGDSMTFEWPALTLLKSRGVLPLTITLSGNDGETNRSNDQATLDLQDDQAR